MQWIKFSVRSHLLFSHSFATLYLECWECQWVCRLSLSFTMFCLCNICSIGRHRKPDTRALKKKKGQIKKEEKSRYWLKFIGRSWVMLNETESHFPKSLTRDLCVLLKKILSPRFCLPHSLRKHTWTHLHACTDTHVFTDARTRRNKD